MDYVDPYQLGQAMTVLTRALTSGQTNHANDIQALHTRMQVLEVNVNTLNTLMCQETTRRNAFGDFNNLEAMLGGLVDLFLDKYPSEEHPAVRQLLSIYAKRIEERMANSPDPVSK